MPVAYGRKEVERGIKGNPRVSRRLDLSPRVPFKRPWLVLVPMIEEPDDSATGNVRCPAERDEEV
jgi:hypothetical protein